MILRRKPPGLCRAIELFIIWRKPPGLCRAFELSDTGVNLLTEKHYFQSFTITV